MRRILACLGLLLALTSCATRPVSPLTTTDPAWTQRYAALKALDTWYIKGRVAFKDDSQSWTASLYWKQAAEWFQVRLVAAFGRGTWQLSGDEQQVHLQTADNRLYTASDSETLLYQNTGWALPLQGLEYWVRGIPDPDSPIDSIRLDIDGRMTYLQQQGWQISLDRYRSFGGHDLPGRVFVESDNFTVKLVIQDWQT